MASTMRIAVMALATLHVVCASDSASRALRGGAERVLSEEMTCEGGIPGIQSKNSCCMVECGQCGGTGCSSAGGLSGAECCESGVEASGLVCSETERAPCIIKPGVTPAPAPGTAEPAPSTPDPAPVSPTPAEESTCDGGFPGIQSNDICCALACGQCGGSGCSSAGGLTAEECCTKDVAAADVPCTIAGAGPCVLGDGVVLPPPSTDEPAATPAPVAESTATPVPVAESTATPVPVAEPAVTPAPVDGSTGTQATKLGCYADRDAMRIMQENTDEAEMTVEKCDTICAGNKFFGLQYGIQCWCGGDETDHIQHGESAMCDYACGGNPDQICGGYWAMTVYEYATPSSSYSDLGCFSDEGNDRILRYVTKSPDMTTEYCEGICAGRVYFGTQYGHECWCGSETSDHLKHGPNETCDIPCEGNTAQICGGYYAMNVYKYNDAPTPEPAPTPAPTELVTAAPVTVTPAPRTPEPVMTKAPVDTDPEPTPEFVGCFGDDGMDRIMELHQESHVMTVETCKNTCAGKAEHAYFGLQYGIQCWCGAKDTETKHGEVANCDTPCAGNMDEMCGGYFAMSLYKF